MTPLLPTTVPTTVPFRHAMCNEAFGTTDFAESCRVLKAAGYEGIEIAPFTLSADPMEISPGRRREYREAMAGEGLAFAGLHWLMVSGAGLHVTTPDIALRERSWERIRHLIDLCADLGPAGVMVFGSPKQRSSTGGMTALDATRQFCAGLAAVAEQAEARGVTVLVEALPKSQSDIVNTIGEAAEIVASIGSAGVQTMFDVHNTEDETRPHTELLEEYFSVIRHVHVNEMDGRYPGSGGYDFGTLMGKLRELDYGGWVSLEVFDFEPGAGEIAAMSREYLKRYE